MCPPNPLQIYLGDFSLSWSFLMPYWEGFFFVISLFSGVQVLNFPNPLTEKEILSSSKMNLLKGHK